MRAMDSRNYSNSNNLPPHHAFDVVVIGAGHAGCEAALAAGRLGARVALVTFSRATVAQMSCNPAIGGLAKGQIVREIDALGGAMGRVADTTAIQFRLLNRSKGHAVRGPRCQSDRQRYAEMMLAEVDAAAGVELVEGEVVDLLTAPDRSTITGVVLADGRRLQAPAVVVTTGTFLNGLMHIGQDKFGGGRIGEPASSGLSAALQRLGLELGRLKTGTPPRLDRDSIDWSRLQVQPGDERPTRFSFLTDMPITERQVPCHITWTNATVHRLLTDNLDHAPLYNGQISSTGPRYCPSIETKIVRFAGHDRHQVFLEPEGRDSRLIYANGISTSMPRPVQDEMVRAIEGLEQARIIRYGYAIEYDFVPPTQLLPTLETKAVSGLYLAGQINGTSGYEEAAGQGLMAGANAALKLAGREPLVLGRDQAYIGVMIDDLVTRGTEEPYRMFTSLAEYRLLLRYDNADRRLTPIGDCAGLVEPKRRQRLQRKMAIMERIEGVLQSGRVGNKRLDELLRRPDVTLESLSADRPELASLIAQDAEATEQVEIEMKYSGYLQRQQRQVDRAGRLESQRIPQGLDYSQIAQMRHEAREKFGRIRPLNLGQAARISGISLSDVAVLEIYLERLRRR